MFSFVHEPAGFDDVMAFYRSEDLRVLSSYVAEFTHNLTVFVVYFDSFLDSQVGDFYVEDTFQFRADMFVFSFEEIDSRADLTVLRLCEDDDRSFAVPFLAHAAESIAGNGEDDSVEAVIRAVELEFHVSLHQGTSERRKVCTSCGDLRVLGTEHAYREVACSVYDFFRSVVRHHAYEAFALFFIIQNRLLGMVGYFL